MNIKFTKMHGLGNDFIVIDGINQVFNLNRQQIAFLAQRHTGIGFDQCLLIEASDNPNIDFNYRIFNADGQEVGQCGNGARCLALFVLHYNLTQKKRLNIATKTTTMQVLMNEDQSVTINMGHPKLAPADIPFITEPQAPPYSLTVNNDKPALFHVINVGNPHAVLLVPDTETADVTALGRQISLHPYFPEQTNVGFMQILAPNKIKLRVYERGSAETQACGSGAVAAAAIARLYYGLDEKITVSLSGGNLVVDWPDVAGPICLTGPASLVYEGTILACSPNN